MALPLPIRRIPSTRKAIYLTFDDGPSPPCTEEVLEVLATFDARATFFLIGEKAKKQRSLVSEMVQCGHTIGNHSLDHRYRRFFITRRGMLEWIQKSENLFRDELQVKPVGFRSPLGIRTPELGWALKQLRLPLIHWNIRFYDVVFPWTEKKALHSLQRTNAGDIVLLHDSHLGEKARAFSKVLRLYLSTAKEMGFEFLAISRTDCLISGPLAPNRWLKNRPFWHRFHAVSAS